MRISIARHGAAALGAATIGCSSMTDAPRASLSVSLALADCVIPAPAVVAPFLTVAESIDVAISAGGTRLFSRTVPLPRYASVVDIPSELTTDQANATFSASVRSSNGAVLFSGDTTVQFRAADYAVTVPICPRRPVLVIAPDTVRSVVDNSVMTQTWTIHNRGLDSLAWQVTANPCPNQCAFQSVSGKVAGGKSVPLTAVVTLNPIPPTTAVFSFGVSSPEGNLTTQWKITPAAVTGVAVSPTSALVAVGQPVQLGATVEPNGRASQSVNWSVSDAARATVNNSGIVTGIAAGTTTISATSAVDPTKTGSATVRVYSVQTAPFPWGIVVPAAIEPNMPPITVTRDGPPSTDTVRVIAQANIGSNPFPAGVEFWARSATVNLWRRIGFATGTPFPGVAGVWRYSLLWNPNATDAPFASGFTPLNVIAVGLATSGPGGYQTQPNTLIRVRVP